jgi:hypothetical protein
MNKEMKPEALENMTLAFAELSKFVEQPSDDMKQRRSQNARPADVVNQEPNGSDPIYRDFLVFDELHGIDEDRFSLDDIDLDDEDALVLDEVEHLS